MDRIRNINPKRIEWSCDEYGITPEILASQLKISMANLEKTMEGREGLTVMQLQKIAKYFQRGLLFYLEEQPVKIETLYTPQYRTLTNKKPHLSPDVKALIERIEKQRQTYLSLLEDLEISDKPNWSNSIQELRLITTGDIKNISNQVRSWLGMTRSENFASLRTKVEDKGAFVFITNGYNGQWQIAKDDPIRGFSVYYPDLPIIAIKKQESDYPQAFTLMHELGHLLLHMESYIDDREDLNSERGHEKVANEFAGNVLVPDDFLKEIEISKLPSGVNDYDQFFTRFSRQWGVSTEVVLRRLLNEHYISNKSYNEYRDWKNDQPIKSKSGGNRTNRFKEPLKMFGAPFVSAVLNAYQENRITLSKASTFLDNLKIKDIHKLERGAW